jgi:hypothetical protein
LPFVIKLKYGSSGYKQSVESKVDTGSKVVGIAAVRSDGKVLYASETETRKDVHKKVKTRSILRRGRRGRKTRYRAPRFDNRRRQDGWLTPTMTSKLATHIREIKYVESILPITATKIEIASFDIHKLTNPDVTKWTYQKGRQKDFYNVKAFVLSRDKHTCQKCGDDKNGTKLHVHHIVFRSNSGTDSPDNLVCMCELCHDKLHKSKNPENESLKLQTKRKTNTTDAVQVSTIGAFLKRLLTFSECFGFETKFNRESLLLPKAHFIDAMCVGLTDGEVVTMPTHVFKKRSISRGEYQQTEVQYNKKGKRPKLTRGKVFGFLKDDRVIYKNTIAFVKGKMSSGYAILSDVHGNKLDFGHVPKFQSMKRFGARKSCLTSQATIENFTSNTISFSSVNIEKTSSRRKKSA